MLAAVYVSTLAPGVTFWDAGEFIAAAFGMGIPHPPGTPLVVALGRAWTLAAGGVLGVARAMNTLSALCTAAAGGLTAWLVAREFAEGDASWGALTGALCAGLMTSAWANATETEVYAVSLLHVVLLLVCAERASTDEEARDNGGRWLRCTAYLIALAPAVHLSVLVGAPAAIALAARRRDGTWRFDRILLLGGVVVSAAGVGRMSSIIVGCGAAVAMLSLLVKRDEAPARQRHLTPLLSIMALAVIGTSALLIMLVRARYDPPMNQGNPSTLATLADVVARRQYEVAPLWPRAAPVWIQLANVAQYADWQFALAWGRGIFTTPVRVLVTLAFLALGVGGWRTMRREGRRVADALALLVLCGTVGVGAYLNLKAGASLGYGFVPAGAHEARERDYFFVLAFWGWGVLAGYGALAFVRARRWPAPFALAVALVPLAGNWAPNDRARGAEATAARDVGLALLESVPPRAVLFVAGDNDSYPLWYLQQVEGVRGDVALVTVPLLPADWYEAEIARRTGLRWLKSAHVPGARWRHEEVAALIARAARDAGRPVAASPALASRERALLGSGWRLRGVVYESSGPADGSVGTPRFDRTGTASPQRVSAPARRRKARLPDDVSAMMLALLDCPRLASLPAGPSAARDSLEVRCNAR